MIKIMKGGKEEIIDFVWEEMLGKFVYRKYCLG